MASTWQCAEASSEPPAKKLRFACDSCHYAKTKCSGGTPCTGCYRSGDQCIYSQSNRVGRPKGTKNKRTLDMMNGQNQAEKSDVDSTNSHSNNGSTKNTNGNKRNSNRSNSGHHRSYSAPENVAPSSTIDQYSPTLQHKQSPQLQNTTATFSLGVDSNFTSSPNIFLGPISSDQDLSFALTNSDTFNDPLGFNFSSGDLGFDGSQNPLQLSMSPPRKSSRNQRSQFYPQTKLQDTISLNQLEATLSDPMNLLNTTATISSMDDKSMFSYTKPTYISPPTSIPFIDEADLKNDISSFGGVTMKSGRTADYLSSPLMTPTSPPASDLSKCNCFENHATLLVRLKELSKGSNPASIDVVLRGIQRAIAPWNHYIQCRVCQRDEDQEVLLLSALSIQAVLRLLQSVYCDRVQGLSLWNPEFTKRNVPQRVGSPTGARFSVGSYEITGEERMLVMEVLISKTLDKVKFALDCLKRRSSKTGNMTPPRGSNIEGSTNRNHVQQLLHGMESAFQVLSRAVRGATPPAVDMFGDMISMTDVMV